MISSIRASFGSIGSHTEILSGITNNPENIQIGESCFLGAGFRLYARGGITIGDVPEFCVVGGNPAKIIKQRSDRQKFMANINQKQFYMQSKLNK